MKSLKVFEEHIKFLTSLFKNHREILEEKESLIIKGDYEALSELVPREESLVMELDQAEALREQYALDLCAELSIPRTSSISEIAESLGQEKGTKLMIIIARLMECLQEISLLHFNIDKMIGFQLKNIKLLQDTAVGQDRINTYDVKGNYRPDNQKKLFKGQG